VGLVPSVAVFLAWAVPTFAGGETRAGEYGAVAQGFGAEYEGLWERLTHGPSQLLEWMRGDDDLLVLVWLGVLALSAPIASARAPTRVRRLAYVPAFLCFAAYFLAPVHLRNQYYVATRMLAPALALLVAAAAPAGGVGLVVGVLGTALTGVWVNEVADVLRAQAREAAGLDAVLAQAEPGKRMVGLALDPVSGKVRRKVYLHAPSWYTVESGGENAFSFALFESSPLRFRDPGYPPHLQPRFEKDPWCELLAGTLAPYDYYLLREGPDPCGVEAALDAEAELVARAGGWALYAYDAGFSPRVLPDVCQCPPGRRGER
jgi:hypothetical protein